MFELRRNELLDARNIEIEEDGRLRVRRGSYQIGDTGSGTIENSFIFYRNVAGSLPTTSFIINNAASAATLSRIRGSRLTVNITSSSITVSVTDATQFTASGTIEIEGDLIAYTGVTGNDLTGVTGINSSHNAGAAVHQLAALTQPGTAVDGRAGVYYAVINNILIVNGRAGNWKQLANDDGTTITEITGEMGGIFITNYRDRAYVVGDGSTGTNGDPRRISFSARGDGTSWTSTDFFDVEDQRGEGVSAQRVLNDKLLFFKPNSIFTYDEIELKQRESYVGAWNHKTPVEIGGLIYTFCPNGIFVTNGFESKNIGEPVKQYWKNFHPIFDSISGRIVTNTFAWKFEHRYFVYIFDITDPETLGDVVLEYDTIKKVWLVHQGSWTNFFHMNYFERFRFGDTAQQFRPALFGGNDSGQFFRFFESRYRDAQATPTVQGTDVFQDLLSNTGSIISGSFETGLYDLTHPAAYKQFKNLRVYVERGQWAVDYRVENENGISAYKPLGTVWKSNQVLPFPVEAAGWRIGFRGAAAETAHAPIFNGFVIEDTQVTKRPFYAK